MRNMLFSEQHTTDTMWSRFTRGSVRFRKYIIFFLQIFTMFCWWWNLKEIKGIYFQQKAIKVYITNRFLLQKVKKKYVNW